MVVKPNGYGLYDMHGNVYDGLVTLIVQHCRQPLIHGTVETRNSVVKLMARSGSFSNNPNQITNYYRAKSAPSTAGGSGTKTLGLGWFAYRKDKFVLNVNTFIT